MLVITPHHVQRRAVNAALLDEFGQGVLRRMLVCAAEKAQGQTKELVIVCYTALSDGLVEADAAFSSFWRFARCTVFVAARTADEAV